MFVTSDTLRKTKGFSLPRIRNTSQSTTTQHPEPTHCSSQQLSNWQALAAKAKESKCPAIVRHATVETFIAVDHSCSLQVLLVAFTAVDSTADAESIRS